MKDKLKTGIPFQFIFLLALLPIPRVVLHDLRIIPFDSFPYKFWAVAPLVVWAIVAVIKKTSQPMKDFVVLGLLYGVFLALTHQILWNASWGENRPQIGGNLTGQLDPTVEELLLRAVAFCSSIVTGLLLGLIFGVIAYVSRRRLKKVQK